MRKLLLFVALVVTGALVARWMTSRAAAPGRPSTPAPATPARLRLAEGPAGSEPSPEDAAAEADVSAATLPPPPPTTNGERVVLMSISSLSERGQDATQETVVAHVGAGEIDPDEGTIDVLLHRLASSGLLAGGEGGGPYRLTPSGQAALLDGSAARPSSAGDAADELSSPTTDA